MKTLQQRLSKDVLGLSFQPNAFLAIPEHLVARVSQDPVFRRVEVY
jgi:hypothetical protein